MQGALLLMDLSAMSPSSEAASLRRHIPLRGILLRLFSVTAFAVMAALVKAAGTQGVSLPELVFYRNAGALPVMIGWLLVGPGFAAVKTKRPMVHLTRSVLGISSMFCYFEALTLLPLAEAITLYYTAPIAATMLSAMFLREHVGPRRWAAVAVAFVGLLIVVQPGGAEHLSPLGVTLGLMGAMMLGMVTVTLRQIATTENTAAIAFWFTVFGALVGASLLPFFNQPHDARTYVLLLASGLTGGMGQLAMTASLRYAPVSVVAPLDYGQIVWTVLIGWAVFGTTPLLTTIVGAVLITASGIYTAYRERVAHTAPRV